MKAIAHMGMIVWLSIYTFSSINAKEVAYCANTKIDKKICIELFTKRYVSETKGLIPHFDGSELLEDIPNIDGKYENIGLEY